MKFSSGPLPARGSGWKARITATAFECETDGRDTRFIFKEITRIDCSTGLVWAAVKICSHSETLRLGSIVNASARLLARTLRERVSKTLLSLLEPHRDCLSSLWQSYTELLEAPHYLAQSDLEKWRRSNSSLHRTSFPAIADLVEHPLFSHRPAPD